MGRIVVVDDDRAFVEAVAIYLQDHGFEAIKAYSGHQAIRECTQRRVDAAIVDVHLPDLEGLDVVSQISSQQPPTPTILISSDDSPEIVRRCKSSAAVAFMVKPLAPAELLESIFRAMRGRNTVIE